jgi:hypothetical protein
MLMMFLMSSLDNVEVVKFQTEGRIIVFFARLRTWTWNAQWNRVSISSSFIPSTEANTDSFRVHLK